MARIRQVTDSRKVHIDLVPEANRMDWFRNQVVFQVDEFTATDEFDMEKGNAKQDYLDELDRKLHEHTQFLFAVESEHVDGYSDNPKLLINIFFESSTDKGRFLKDHLTIIKLAS